MTLYLLSEWEINGYHDSDFEAAVWDTEKDCVRRIEIGSTRYAGGRGYDGIETDIPDDILDKSIDWLAETFFYYMRLSEDSRVLEPNEIEKGQRVRLLKDKRNKAKVADTSDCWSCNGTGEWVNPRNDEDVRDCFKCNGTGEHVRYVAAPKVDGKVQWERFSAGDAGVVQWAGTFNQIYQRGYNQYGRSTISTRVLMDDGRIMNADLRDLRLDEEPATDEELQERAVRRAQGCKFGAVLNPRYAWDSRNNALSALNSRKHIRL